jgi:NodT family efflux transporter outer membrane factor (OMF) lipoprotein
MHAADWRWLAVIAVSLTGCSLAPHYKVPEVAVPAAYKEAAPWTAAQPSDAVSRGEWWSIYNDADLDRLQTALLTSSPDLATALARYQQAKAYSDQLRSSLFPSLDANAGASRNGVSKTSPQHSPTSANNYNVFTVGATLDYEVDLWGRVRDTVAAGRAQEQAAAADFASARLSLQTQLADTYVVLRGLDREIQLLDDTVQAYQRALDLTRQRHDGGIASGLDVARAETQLHTAQSQVSQTRAQRALYEHTIAALVGEPAPSFTLAPKLVELRVPETPTDVPSSLLERRPDIAAAERRSAAANASIGIARSAFFPSVGLSATGGYQSTDANGWLSAPNAFWAVGPSLALTLFDFGLRKAQLAQAHAALDEAGAQYRSTVLSAFKQVEDNLALLDNYREAIDQENAAVVAAQRSLDFAMTRYRQGAVDYLEVVDSQTAALVAQRTALGLSTNRLQASVQLIKALGGGWNGDTRIASTASQASETSQRTERRAADGVE